MIYAISGNVASEPYNLNAEALETAYNIAGNIVFQASEPSDPYIEGRTLVFEDNFEGSTLNSNNWGYELGDVRNSELQTYRAENNISVEDGCLVIAAKKEDFGTKHWTSGSITGQHKFEQVYGRWEAKVKFPNIIGAFGAFWLLGANMENVYHEIGDNDVSGVIWPKCGEIDITETIPGNATTAQANLWKYTGGSMGAGRSNSMVSSEWHIYAMEWTSEYIAIFLDGVEFKRWTFSDYSVSEVQAYHLPFYMILNLAVGASGGTPASSTNEMKMYVDWVRVYAPLS